MSVRSETKHAPPKGALSVGLFTFFSRIFGLIRDSLIAYLLGGREKADAFYVAFRIPNLFRRLLAEGSLTLSFIPVFTEYLKKDPKEAKQLVHFTFTLLLVVLIVLTALGILFAEPFLKLSAPGFQKNPEQFELTVSLMQITFPYLIFVSLGALAMGILNTLKSFSAPAAAPILLNIAIILTGLGAGLAQGNIPKALGWGVIIGGAAQLAIQIPVLRRLGFLPAFQWSPKHPAVQKICNLMLPTLYGSAVYQINVLCIQFFASKLPAGAVTALWNADRVMEFPLGVFAVSLATVILPKMSEETDGTSYMRLKESLRNGLRWIALLNIPAAVGMFVLAEPIILLLFKHGHFDAHAAAVTASVLKISALGLPFVSATRITAPTFYALRNAKKTVRAGTLSILIGIVSAAILAHPIGFGVQGLALGVVLGSITNFILHFFDLRREIGLLGTKKLAGELFKIFSSSILMGILLTAISNRIDWTGHSKPALMRDLLGLILLGVFTYAALGSLLKIETLREFLTKIKNRFYTNPIK